MNRHEQFLNEHPFFKDLLDDRCITAEEKLTEYGHDETEDISGPTASSFNSEHN